MRHAINQIVLLNAAAANGASAAASGNVEAFTDVAFQVAMVGFTGTIKFVASDADTAPDFGAAATAANPFDYIQVKDMQDNAGVNGNTGITGTAATTLKNYELNSEGKKWVGAIVNGYTVGTITVKMKAYTLNQ